MKSIVKYESIIDHYESCLAEYGDSHLGVDWPNKQDAEKRYQVMLEVIRDDRKGLTLLDFGCGASHLYGYIRDNEFSGLEYHGLDISPAFYTLSRNKYPETNYYCMDVLAKPNQLQSYDYIIMNGIFTEKREMEFDEMFEYFKNMLRVVFPKVRRGLAFNVMSKHVEWERDDLFHMPIDTLVSFLTMELSRNFIIRNDYGLYEYTVYLYKEPNHG